MKIAKVKDIPVRYKGETHQPGTSFEMEADHVNEDIVEVIGEVEKAPKEIGDMVIAELKDYAAENKIDLKGASKRDDILAVIQAAEAKEDGENTGADE